MNEKRSLDIEDRINPVISLPALLLILAAAAGGALAAAIALPSWLPGLQNSLTGSAPQVFWYLARSSALVAYIMLWISMCLGLLISNKLAKLWPGGPTAVDLHQFTSILGLVLALFHGLILTGDRYLKASLGQVLTPFALAQYHPFWVGLGQLGFYLMAGVTFSFYIRKALTHSTWRALHYLSFAAYLFALIHGIGSGTDQGAVGFQMVYWSTGGVFLFLMVYRIVASLFQPSKSTGSRDRHSSKDRSRAAADHTA
jgi:predicted ferric reductase